TLLATFTAGPPVVAGLNASYNIFEDEPLYLPIVVNDYAVDITTVQTIATSSNTNLVSKAGLWITGSGTNRILWILPALHATGTATITLVTSDYQPVSVTNSFTLTVFSEHYAPMFVSTIP